jgi:hypothetical protein
MGIVLAFAVGYVVGANAGQEGYRDVVNALRSVRDSDEFSALLSALRSHASATLQRLGELLEETPVAEPFNPARLIDRVRELIDRAGIDPAPPFAGRD